MVSHSFGISMQETTGTLAAFAESGMIGSDAGTSLKTMLISLANPSTKAANTMKELGINAYDAQGNFIGLSGLAGQLRDKMSGLSQEQRNQALATIFGTDAIRAANVLYEQGAEGIDDWTKAVSESGFAAQQAAARNNNLKGDLETLSGSFESLMISLGEGGQGPLRSLVQMLDTLVDGFSQLPAPVQQGIVLFTALAGGSVALHKAMAPLNASSSQLAQTLGLIADPGQRLIGLGSGIASAFQTWGATFGSAESQINTFGTTVSRSQGVMAGFKNLGSGIVSLLGGPWGIAIGVAGAALLSFADKAAEAKQRADSLKTALESTGDASKQIIDNLSNAKIDNSWIIPDNIEQAYYGYKTLGSLLDDVGIKMSDMALAAQGNSAAMRRINGVTDEMIAKGGKQKELAGIILSQLNEEKDNYNKASDAAKSKAHALAEVENATNGAADATGEYSNATQGATTSTQDLMDAIDDLVKGFLSLPGVQLSADQAVTQFNQGILDLNESIAKNGRVLDDNGNALAGYESQAYDSQSALQGLASTAQSTAQKIIEEGQAHGDAAAATQQAGDILERARQAYIDNATAAGMSADAAAAQADRYGLARSQADVLRQGIEKLNSTAANPVDVKITITDEASDVLDKVKAKAEKIDDKTVRISGDNTDLMQKIADATGATIDPKTGKLDLDKTQFDYAMAIAAGATIDPKTGLLQGDNSDMLAKVAEANGWTIDPKTGYIYANDDQAIGVLQGLNNMQIADKWFTIHGKYEDSSGGTYSSSGYRPKGAMGNIPTGKTGGLFTGYGVSMRGYATGGRVIEGLMPGKATYTGEDNITLLNARVKSGEFVSNVKSVGYYGADLYAAMNRRQIPREVFAKVPAAQTVPQGRAMQPSVTNVTVNVAGSKSPEVVARETVEIIRRELGVRQ